MSAPDDFFAERKLLITPTPISRGRGCWSCIHWSSTAGAELWKARRVAHEQQAIDAILVDPIMGKERAAGIQSMIRHMDTLVSQGAVGTCRGGCDRGDLYHHEFLCERWNGRDGHSLATQGKADKLPEELLDERDSTLPQLDVARSIK